MYQCSKYKNHLNISNKKIRELRLKNNMSLTDLSTKLSLVGIDIPKQSLHKLEKGDRIIKDFELVAFAKVLNVTVEELLQDFISEFEQEIIS